MSKVGNYGLIILTMRTKTVMETSKKIQEPHKVEEECECK